MKPTMMEGTKSPAVVIQTPEANPAPSGTSSVKKYAVIGVTAVLVTLILTAGIVTTAVMLSKTNADIIKSTMSFKDAMGDDVTEEIDADLQHNTATYTVHGSTGKLTVVRDYNKKLGVMVFHNATEPYCVVHYLNTTNSAKDDIVDVNKPRSTQTIDVTMVRDDMPVVDASFLPTQAQELCSGMDTFWATERFGEVTADQGHRTKRQRRPPIGTVCYPYGGCERVYIVTSR